MSAFFNGTSQCASNLHGSTRLDVKIAAIDVGSNSIHMVVVERELDGRLGLLERAKESVRLAADLSRTASGEALSPHRIEAALACLARFTRIARSHGVSAILGAATSAVRDATNGHVLLDRARAEHGLDVRVLAPLEEARLIYRGARDTVRLGAARALFVDIGGGSAEVSVGDRERLQAADCRRLGAIRMTERFLEHDPPLPAERAALTAHADAELAGIAARSRRLGFERVVGTSGTILALAKVLSERSTGIRRIAPFTLAELSSFNEAIAPLDGAARREVLGISENRARSIAAGALVLERILVLTGATRVEPCSHALREGLVLDHLDRLPLASSHVRERSVLALARRSRCDLAHGFHVRALAFQLFDQLAPLHGLGAVERELLGHASVLHDSGKIRGFSRHHRHAYEVIRNAGLAGFGPAELELTALLARYHRKAGPTKDHAPFAALAPSLRRVVRQLAGILRVADALDRRGEQRCRRVSARVEANAIVLEVASASDLVAERLAVLRKTSVLEDAFDRRVLVTSAPARVALAAG